MKNKNFNIKRFASATILAVAGIGFVTNTLAKSPQASLSKVVKATTKIKKPIKTDHHLNKLYREYRTHLRRGLNQPFKTKNSSLSATDKYVTVDAVAIGDPADTVAELEAMGMKVTAVYGRIISGQLPIKAIKRIDSLINLRNVRAAMAQKAIGLTTTQGDFAQFSDLARLNNSLDGTGVTVGALSDSFDCQLGAATDVASNDLPTGIINLQEEIGCNSGSDEGRAIMQIVHDVAPGTKQLFHSAFNGMASFASGILTLQANGAKVIVDDVFYFAEPFFQDGVIAQAVDIATALGVSYFSSAGNSARQSYEASFVPSGVFPKTTFGGEAHDFDPGPGTDAMQSVTIPAGGILLMSFQWDSPFFSASGVATSNDIDITLFDSTGAGILAESADNNLASGDPVEIIFFDNSSGATTVNANLAVTLFTGPVPGRIKYIHYRNTVINEYTTNSSTVVGHSNAAGAEAVGAAAFFNTPWWNANVFPVAVLEPYSSSGSTDILFDIQGNPIQPITRQKPEIVGPDGGNTTFFGQQLNDGDAFPNFFGTSASAPHVAAVAALMLENHPVATPSAIREALELTADDMDVSGVDDNTGNGFIQADFAVNAIVPCEGNFDADNDVDGLDLSVFALDFGRTNCNVTGEPACEGDFEGDGDVDGLDLSVFALDFGRANCVN